MKRLSYHRGQSLLEIIVALGIFSILVMALSSLATGGTTGFIRGGEYTEAQGLVGEAMEAIRSVREGAWNEIAGSNVIASIVGGQWQLSSGASELINNKYTRTITLEDVCRTPAGDRTPCPPTGSNYKDPHSKKITASVSWGFGNVASSSMMLTNWESKDWTQSDWSGGTGQTILSDSTKYSSGTNVDHAIAGQINLVPASNAVVARSAGGPLVSQTTAADFSAGTLSNVQVSGSGTGGFIELSKGFQVSQDAASGVVTNKTINSISAVPGTDEVWAVGNNGLILHYTTAGGWVLVPPPSGFATKDITSVSMVSTTDGWATLAAGTAVLHYDGINWSPSNIIPPGYVASAVVHVGTAPYNLTWFPGKNGFMFRYQTAPTLFAGVESILGLSAEDFTDGYEMNGMVVLVTQQGTSYFQVAPYENPPNGNWGGPATFSIGSAFNAVHGDGTNFWIASNNGQVLRAAPIYTGNGGLIMTRVSSGVPNVMDVRDIFMVSPTDGWIVGSGGRILRWDGNALQWNTIVSPTTVGLNGVVITASGDGWIVGSAGTILRIAQAYNTAGTFTSGVVDAGTQNTSWDIVSWSQTIPAGGSVSIQTRTGNTSVPDASWSVYSPLLTKNASQSVVSPPGQYLQYQVSMTRGAVGTLSPQVFDVTFVTQHADYSAGNLRDVFAVSSNEAWAVGAKGSVLHTVDGTHWTLINPRPTQRDLYGVFFTSSTNGWAVGEAGFIMHYDGVSWQPFSSPTNNQLNGIFMLSKDEGRIVGQGGTILHWNSIINAWEPEPSGIDNRGIQDVEIMNTPTGLVGYAVGNASFVDRYANGTWTIQNPGPINQNLFSVDMVTPTNIWAVGAGGKIWHSTNGTTWVSVTSPVTAQLNAVSMSSATDGWAVSSNGQILHYDGTTWNSIPSPNSDAMYGLGLITSQSGWIVGQSTMIVYFSSPFASNGSFTSSAFNMTDNSPVQAIEWDEDIPVNCIPPTCAIRMQVSVAPDVSGSPGAWSEWAGPNGIDGNETDYFTIAKGTLIPASLNGKRWVRYRAFLDGDSLQSYTPILKEVRINYK